MTIYDTNEFQVCQNRLSELEARAEQIITHPQKSRRVKEMEMAGIRGMIEQLQREIQAYELAQIQHSIHALRDELQGVETTRLPDVIQKTLDVLEEMTHVMQPVANV